MTIKYKSIKEIKSMISQKEISYKEVVREVFSLIKENEDLDTDEIEFSMKSLKDYNRFTVCDFGCCMGLSLIHI